MGRKVAVLGVGHVGAHVAYNLVVQDVADEVVLLDQNKQKIISECQDLKDAMLFMTQRTRVVVGDFEDLKDCDVLVVAVGDISLLATGGSRINELDFNVRAINSFADKINVSGFDGIIINISNPCDIITRQLQKKLNLSKERIFGTGTGLDTSRLVSEISQALDIDHTSIIAYMLGEHGASQFAPWSIVRIGGKLLSEWESIDPKFDVDKVEINDKAIQGGWVTYAGKQCTEYGISATACKMVDIVLKDSKTVLPVSTLLKGQYGQSDIVTGVPAIIGRNGIEHIVELPIDKDELQIFAQCCEKIREYMDMADAIECENA